MSKFLETYGVALFTLVLVAILIAFAGPLGLKIKNAVLEKTATINELGNDEITNADTQIIQPTDSIYACLYTDGELILSSSEIVPEKTVDTNFGLVLLSEQNPPSWTSFSGDTKIKIVNFKDKIKLTTCYRMFYSCRNLKEIKNKSEKN